MIRFLANDDGRVIHAEAHDDRCNIPEARAEGEKGVELISFSAAALLRWELGWRVCEWCIGSEPADSPKDATESPPGSS